MHCLRRTIHTPFITWSQLNHSSFAQESTVCTKQHLGREYSMLPSVTTHLSFTKSVVMSVAVSKVGVVFCRAWSEVLVGYLTITTNVSCYQTRRWWQYYLPFSNTADVRTSTCFTQHSSTTAKQNSQLHFLWAVAQQARAELSWFLIFVGESAVACIRIESQQHYRNKAARNSGKAVIRQ